MELTNRENWRSISEYLNYEVSDVGRVRNVNTGKILKPSVSARGYLYVSLCNSGKIKKHLTHRLVASEFIENLSNKPIVDHIDHNTSNNCVMNLRWATKSENNMNQTKQNHHSSKYKGVSLYKRIITCYACVKINGKTKRSWIL